MMQAMTQAATQANPSIVWQRQSVADCFAGFTWQGASAPLSVESVGQSGWQTTAVQDFFRQYNWAGEVRSALPQTLAEMPQGLAMRLPVKQFFAGFVWAGQPLVAPQPSTPIPAPAGDRDFKLANFSNLF
jgi:hypothetical protein